MRGLLSGSARFVVAQDIVVGDEFDVAHMLGLIDAPFSESVPREQIQPCMGVAEQAAAMVEQIQYTDVDRFGRPFAFAEQRGTVPSAVGMSADSHHEVLDGLAADRQEFRNEQKRGL